ncbi:fungal-specific transcription factor domain-containing protein [Aspergillus bertholletiae]|uniref:Fungal-specific transcription factor domain-containing protein n=1 Tax=Aspergillus bertholletiae TaxID=1226010 RepID=A0A5N7AT29_9EURO|nr:fungal-specific transcription factor domain-containing protein [Aspergillus bertholletiae]
MRESQLSWQPVFSLSRKPVRRPRTRRPNTNPHQLQFIVEHPSQEQDSIPFVKDNLCCLDWLFNDFHTRPIISSPDLNASHRIATERLPYPHSRIDQCLPGHSSEGEAERSGASVLSLTTQCEELSIPTCIPSGVLYSTLGQRYHNVLERYNAEFCQIPLTSDFRVNPFQYRQGSDPSPMFLVHAVMALAGHHVKSTSSDIHRHAALQSLCENLDRYYGAEYRYSILDTIIILFSLHETQSALGTWRTHLLGAYGLFEACGGIDKWVTSARTQVQIGILLWWDAITSLANREDCVFPYAYLESLLSKYNGQEWDFFRLCGCPLNLVKLVMQLARLAAEKRRSSLNLFATFDNTTVSLLENSLESWRHVSPPAAVQDEESMQQDVENVHCSEAWRNGLLLYVYRVFQWVPGCSVPVHILYRARIIMDHVVASLLPLLFAGCELQDPSLHRKILGLCASWNDRTGFHMFNTTIPLLEVVWAEQKIKGFENVWWGQVIERQHASDSCSPLEMRIFFG